MSEIVPSLMLPPLLVAVKDRKKHQKESHHFLHLGVVHACNVKQAAIRLC